MAHSGTVYDLGNGLLAVASILVDSAGTPQRTPNVYKNIPPTAVTAGTPVTIWTPTAGTRFVLMGWSLSVSTACAVIFKYGAGNTEFLRGGAMAANSHQTLSLGQGLMPGAINDVMKVDISTGAGINVQGFVYGTEVA